MFFVFKTYVFEIIKYVIWSPWSTSNKPNQTNITIEEKVNQITFHHTYYENSTIIVVDLSNLYMFVPLLVKFRHIYSKV